MPFLFDRNTPLDTTPLDLVVHVGAGRGDVLDTYAGLVWKRLVLVEGDPDAAVELQAAVGTRSGIEVAAQVVAPSAGRVEWHRVSPPSLSGPRSAHALRSVYPRLRAWPPVPISAVTLESLLASHARDDALPHLLVMDVPGQEEALLRSVDGDLLRRFEWIVLCGCGLEGEPGWVPLRAAVGLLAQEGFVEVETGEGDPVWPRALLRFDAGAHRLRRLGEALAQAEAERSQESERAARQAAQLERLERELSAARAAAVTLEADLTAARAQRERLDGIVAERDRQLATLQAARDTDARVAADRLAQIDAAAAARVAELDAMRRDHRSALDTLQREHDEREATHVAALRELQKQVDAQRNAREAAERERDALRQAQLQAMEDLQARHAAALSALQREHAEAMARHAATLSALQREHSEANARQAAALSDLQRQHDQLAGKLRDQQDADRRAAEHTQRLLDELAEARQAAALSTKLQTLREADLRDLQDRYRATRAQQQSQHELLTKLAQRLTAAHQYFNELSLTAPHAAPTPATRKLRRREAPSAPPPLAAAPAAEPLAKKRPRRKPSTSA